MDEITVLQAEVLKTLASPRRLEILHALDRGPLEVGIVFNKTCWHTVPKGRV